MASLIGQKLHLSEVAEVSSSGSSIRGSVTHVTGRPLNHLAHIRIHHDLAWVWRTGGSDTGQRRAFARKL